MSNNSKDNKRVLWVEDDIYTLFEPMMHEFVGSNIEILTATNYVEAMHLIKNNNVDLIILDLIIPYGDKRRIDIDKFVGIELLREIRNMGMQIPVLVFSVVRDQEIVNSCKNLGVKNYISKGHVTPKGLKTEVEKYI